MAVICHPGIVWAWTPIVSGESYGGLHAAQHRDRTQGGAFRGRQPLSAKRRPADRHRRARPARHGRGEGRRTARRNRYGQVGDDRMDDREAPASDPGDGTQQDARRPAGQRIPRAAAEQRGGVFRLLLRLLPARGVRPPDGHLHREGLLDQRGGGAPPPQRHQFLLTRRDVVVVASVSCIYGLGTPQEYVDRMVPLKVGEEFDRDQLLRRFVDIQYTRNDVSFTRAPSASGATPSRSSRSTRSWPSASRCSVTRSRPSPRSTPSPAR